MIKSAILKIIVVFGCACFYACAPTMVHNEKIVKRSASIDSTANPLDLYAQVRAKWTTRLGAVMPEGGGMGIPGFSPAGGNRMGGGGFPLRISATIMGKPVLEAGFSYYQSVIGMTQQEADSFRQRYKKRNKLDQYYLMELELQTRFAESYLNLDRWTIFVEDDIGRKYEPAKITEEPVISHHQRMMMPRPGREKPLPVEMDSYRKVVFFYFPKKDFYGNPTFNQEIKKLTLVFILEKGGSGRAEGSWFFN